MSLPLCHRTTLFSHPNSFPPDETLFELIARNASLAEITSKLKSDPKALERWDAKKEQSPLDLAVTQKNQQVVELLVAYGADLNAYRQNGRTLLHEAAYEGDAASLRFLISLKVIVDKKTEDGLYTPLYLATQSGNAEAVEELLKAKADLTIACGSEQKTVLHFAFQTRASNLVRLLLSYGHDLEEVLAAAFQEGDLECLRVILEFFSTAHQFGSTQHTFLHYAALYDRDDFISLLIERGANPEDKDEKGRTPIALAVIKGNLKAMQALYDRNANLRIALNENELTLIHIAAAHNQPNVVTWLLDHGFSADEKDQKGTTPLLEHIMGKKASIELIDLLLQRGANIDECDSNGSSPLYMAVSLRKKAIVDHLLKKKAAINGKRKIPLHAALLKKSEQVDVEIIHQLLEKGASPFMKTARGYPILYIAMEKKFNLVELFKPHIERMQQDFSLFSSLHSLKEFLKSIDPSDPSHHILEEILTKKRANFSSSKFLRTLELLGNYLTHLYQKSNVTIVEDSYYAQNKILENEENNKTFFSPFVKASNALGYVGSLEPLSQWLIEIIDSKQQELSIEKRLDEIKKIKEELVRIERQIFIFFNGIELVLQGSLKSVFQGYYVKINKTLRHAFEKTQTLEKRILESDLEFLSSKEKEKDIYVLIGEWEFLLGNPSLFLASEKKRNFYSKEIETGEDLIKKGIDCTIPLYLSSSEHIRVPELKEKLQASLAKDPQNEKWKAALQLLENKPTATKEIQKNYIEGSFRLLSRLL